MLNATLDIPLQTNENAIFSNPCGSHSLLPLHFTPTSYLNRISCSIPPLYLLIQILSTTIQALPTSAQRTIQILSTTIQALPTSAQRTIQILSTTIQALPTSAQRTSIYLLSPWHSSEPLFIITCKLPPVSFAIIARVICLITKPLLVRSSQSGGVQNISISVQSRQRWRLKKLVCGAGFSLTCKFPVLQASTTLSAQYFGKCRDGRSDPYPLIKC
jgi:hypothetical protein